MYIKGEDLISHKVAEEVGNSHTIRRQWPMIFVRLPDGIHQIIFEGFIKKGRASAILMDDLTVAPCSTFCKFLYSTLFNLKIYIHKYGYFVGRPTKDFKINSRCWWTTHYYHIQPPVSITLQ